MEVSHVLEISKTWELPITYSQHGLYAQKTHLQEPQ